MADSSKVRVAVTGAVSIAPKGTTLPTTANGTLATAFKDLGFVSEDGVTETRDRSTNKIKAWQNAAVLREVVTEASVSYKCVLVETNADTVGLYYGTTVDPTTGALVIVPSASGGRRIFVFDVIDGTDLIRAVAPEAELTEVGDQVYKNGEPIGYEVTIACYPSTLILDANGQPGSVKKFYSSLKTS